MIIFFTHFLVLVLAFVGGYVTAKNKKMDNILDMDDEDGDEKEDSK